MKNHSYAFKYTSNMLEEPAFYISASTPSEAINKAKEIYGPQVDDMYFQSA